MTDATPRGSLGEIALTGQRQDATAARAFTRQVLADAQWPGPVDDVVLLVSEVVANVALHAHTEGRLVLLLQGSLLRVEVHDRSASVPHRRTYGPDATTGRGLQLVAMLAESSGVDSRSDGKVVWFEVDSAGSSAPAEMQDRTDLSAPSNEAGDTAIGHLIGGLEGWGGGSEPARLLALVGV